MSVGRRAVLALGLALLAACAPRVARLPGAPDESKWLAAQAAREASLAEAPGWSLSGRVAVSVQGEGGSGRLEWSQSAGSADIRLSAPISRQGWWLQVRPGLARLEGLPEGPREGPDAEALLREATGWTLPVQALSSWVRGARAPGPARIEFGPDGLPARLEQDGWVVEYREWGGGEPARPKRVFARRGEASVRLVVDRWGPP